MEITLIYPHQLFVAHPAVACGRDVWLIEEPLFFGVDPTWKFAMHAQKLLLHRASMKAFAEELEEDDHSVQFVDAVAMRSDDLLEKCLPDDVDHLHICEVADYLLERRIKRFTSRRNIAVTWYSSPNFLSPKPFLKDQLSSRKKLMMGTFYQAQRVRMGILVDDHGAPSGGRWSFDEENRKKLPSSHQVPPEPRSEGNGFTQEAANYVRTHFPNCVGKMEGFRWPVTRSAAVAWFEKFLDERLENFGPYEDAISIKHASIYHACITPMLNIGLLDPHDLLERILARQERVPMNSLEGIIRQMIGWREFMHGIYQHRGVAQRTSNYWKFTRRMPKAFYDGSTGIAPVDRVIRQVLSDGYCHHIERLMILGNMMLLCRIVPDDVYQWFMEFFVDSYDWVMVPNVYGMSQFADGGIFATKPYLSGSNYVLKMSDEPRGEWCDIWDALFWTFIADHLQTFSKNPRMSMMAVTWSRMPEEKQQRHLSRAESFFNALDGEN
ncbi:MAG: cryptochrome/photolyase family protein [Verrucomicrobia bacterium]|nr:MAG: cryptochrome/photolyase family protein [Verrucomicrobiota bacterium]